MLADTSDRVKLHKISLDKWEFHDKELRQISEGLKLMAQVFSCYIWLSPGCRNSPLSLQCMISQYFSTVLMEINLIGDITREGILLVLGSFKTVM